MDILNHFVDGISLIDIGLDDCQGMFESPLVADLYILTRAQSRSSCEALSSIRWSEKSISVSSKFVMVFRQNHHVPRSMTDRVRYQGTL